MLQIADIIEKCRRAERITADEALTLWQQAPLWQLAELAVAAKRRVSGDKVYYNRNFHLEPTNVCLFECKFCSYRRREGEEGAWDYTMEQVLDTVRSRKGSGATEIHIVGGVHPVHDLYYYADMIRKVKQIMPQVPGCTEVTISRDEYTPEYQVVFDREKLSMHGLNVATAGTYLRNRVNGATASYSAYGRFFPHVRCNSCNFYGGGKPAFPAACIFGS